MADDIDIFDWLASVRGDPLAFTLGAFPWREPGTVLEKFDGPDQWSIDLMNQIKDGILDINTAVRIAIASGHGIGKSATVSWIILWAFCTAPDTRGVITANTETQLRTKTWAELGKWFNLAFFTREYFNLTATSLTSKDPDRERTWRIDAIAWNEKNPAAFAGSHNQGRRFLFIFDEASEIADIIWETAEGGLSDADTEIIWCVFGNPTKSTGRFRECFDGGQFSKLWIHRQIDSRTVKITNKAYIQQCIDAYGGEDNDVIRYRWLGQFPRLGLMEFFSSAEIDEAMSREVTVSRTDPLALGVDVARYGMNDSVLFPRKGRDARSIPRQRYHGISTVALTDHVVNFYAQYRPDGIMIDGGGVGGGVVDNVRNRRMHCFDVQFGGKDIIFNSPLTTGERYANNRAAMYGACRAWLKGGALPNDPELKRQMLAIRYTFNGKDEILLERKEDLVDENGTSVSVDDIDALCLTFSHPIVANPNAGGDFPHPAEVITEYDPYAPERMLA